MTTLLMTTLPMITSSDTDDADLVDLVFGGEDLDHLLVLSKKHLYKLTGVVLQPRRLDTK